MTKLSTAGPSTPPKTLWEKTLTYTPVVMTVIATLLAGMSNSELSAAQYERAAAAQYQSKAADQWNFFQVKKVRGSSLDNTVDLVQTLSPAGIFDVAALKSAVDRWPARLTEAQDPSAAEAARLCTSLSQLLDTDAVKGPLSTVNSAPVFTPKPIASRELQAAVDAIGAAKPDDQVDPLVRDVDMDTWSAALRTAQDNAAAFDTVTAPTNKALDSIRGPLEALAAAANSAARSIKDTSDQALTARAAQVAEEVQSATADFTTARLRFGARRYAMEAPLNQELALLTEVRVHKANLEAEHHRQRSRLFFVGVLIAQAAVIGATLALAMKQKSLLWTIAAIAGLTALSFGIYVRVFV